MLIGIAGDARSGKDTVADIVADIIRDAKKFAFADEIKRIARRLWGFTDEQVHGAEKDEIDTRYGRTPRWYLIQLGQKMREIDEDVWVNVAIDDALQALNTTPVVQPPGRPNWALDRTRVVTFPGTRFINEAARIRALNGQVWLVQRPGAGLEGELAYDSTELEHNDPKFLALVTLRIINDGSKDELRQAVKTALGFTPQTNVPESEQ